MMAKKDKPIEPRYMTPDNVKSVDQIKPNFNWDRPIASPGRMAVDFEERVNFQRLPGTAEPYVWDFGSAAKHHRMFCPWLQTDHVRAGMVGLRGAVAPDAGLFRRAAA